MIRRALLLAPLLLVLALALPCVLAAREAVPASPTAVPSASPMAPMLALSTRLVGLYQSAAPAVVGIECRNGRFGDMFGTGVIIDPTGLVLTSVTVVPEGSTAIRVFLSRGRVAEARVLLVEAEKEFTLLSIRDPQAFRDPGADGLPFVHLGDSESVRLGQPVFTLGNSFRSIVDDDQVTFAAGVVSGLFELTEKRSQSTYAGHAIETSAALNDGMDGGPLLDANGQVVGLLSLNYARARWLGTAVPINDLKPLIARHRDWFDDRSGEAVEDGDALADGKHFAGLELEQLGGDRVRVARLASGGPAALAGLEPGDVLVSLRGEKLDSIERWRSVLREASTRGNVPVGVERAGERVEIVLRLWRRY